MIIALQPPKKLDSEKEKQEKIIWTDKFYEGSKRYKNIMVTATLLGFFVVVASISFN